MKKLTAYKRIFLEFATDANFINETIKKLNLTKNSRILDTGTGIGAMSTLLALNGFHILTGEPEVEPEGDNWNHHDHLHGDSKENHHDNHGDFNREDWNDWRESAKALGVEGKIKFQNFDVEDLPFSNEFFDGIFLYDTLQHVKNREIALNECLRILNTNGVIVVIEWTKKQIEEDYKKYGYRIDFIDPRDILKRDDISTELVKGEAVNIYLLQKK
jgi:ubiquinone/menaquinone biosynthesis C-methylase UbiE